MTVYLCTCGTSAAKNLPKPPAFNSDCVKVRAVSSRQLNGYSRASSTIG